MPNLPVSPNWRWPEAARVCVECGMPWHTAFPGDPRKECEDCRPQLETLAMATVAQLREDRDELVAALYAAVGRLDGITAAPGDGLYEARTLLARIRGGG